MMMIINLFELEYNKMENGEIWLVAAKKNENRKDGRKEGGNKSESRWFQVLVSWPLTSFVTTSNHRPATRQVVCIASSKRGCR